MFPDPGAPIVSEVSPSSRRKRVEPPSPGINRRERPVLFAEGYARLVLPSILLLALGLRIAALLSLKGSVYFDFLLWDERVYHDWAARIAQGTYESGNVYQFSPLPAYVMALVYKLLSPDILYIRLLNILWGVLTCLLVYFIAAELGNRLTGLVACLAAACYTPFIFYSIVPLKTSLSVFMFALAVYLLLARWHSRSWVPVLLLGLISGLLPAVRENYLVLVPLFFLVILFNRYRKGASMRPVLTHLVLYAAGVVVALSPFIVRNYRVAGEFAPVTSQGGFNLYLANNLENPYPYYRPVSFASSVPADQGVQFTIEASRREGRRLSPQEASAYWIRETLRTAFQRPAAFAGKFVRKILTFLNRFEAGDHYHIGFLAPYVGFFRIPLIGLGLILPLGLAGMAVSSRKSGRHLAVTATFVLYASTLVLFFTSTRYRLPVLVILIPFAVAGIQHLFASLRSGDRKGVWGYIAVAAAFFVIEFLPVAGTNDMTAYYNTHAIILSSKGLKEEAARYWQKSSLMNRPYSAYADLALAGEFFKGGDTGAALYHLDRIPENSFAAAAKYGLRGDMMAAQGNLDRAIADFERSLDINSGRKKTGEKLVKAYWRKDRQKALEAYERLEYVSSFFDVKK